MRPTAPACPALAEEIGEDPAQIVEVAILLAIGVVAAFGIFAVVMARLFLTGSVDLSAIETRALFGILEQVIGA
ncbi:hypothetical protein [Paracoccus cavernae]|uniref:hypothetical protein n=1 Tax=Paracoccus cavernae TaxID=1571207 RepID=UPI003627DE22